MSDDAVARVLALAADPSTCTITIDLPAQMISREASGERIAFDFDPAHKDMLVRGLSAVDATLEQSSAIKSFEQAYYAQNPWLA